MNITRSTRSLLATLAAGALVTVGMVGCASEEAPKNDSSNSSSSNSSTDNTKKTEENKSSNDSKEQKAVFSQEQNGVKVTLTYYYVGDDVVRQSTENFIDYAAAGLADEQAARDLFEPLVKDFQGVKGLEHKMTYGPTSATENLTVDYSEADLAEISKLTGSTFSGDTSKGAKLSFKASRDMLLKGGFTEE